MSNDPFKNFKPLNAPKARKKTAAPAGDSFVEQIKNIGGSAVSSFKNDVVKGTAQSIFDQLLGTSRSSDMPQQESDNNALEEWVKAREESAAEEARQEERAFQQHKKTENVLFSFADEKLNREISEVRQELAMLVKTMDKVETALEQAAMQEVVDPGLYHLNFFQKLKAIIIMARKSLEESATWLSMHSGRKQKGYFWTQVSKSGTKYSMSSERNVVMGAG